jgi:hypothetical protein
MAPSALRDIGTRPVSRESGQTLVETALTMPLFVFVILGTLQLGLMHQAHAMTKYAAYKAVRAGALRSAKMDSMERAAVAVLLPMISWQDNGIETVMPITSVTKYAEKVELLRPNRMWDGGLKYVQVKICGPTKQNARLTQGINSVAQKAGSEVQFDAPRDVNALDWKSSETTKLRIEVTFNYRLVIPFANMVIYWITRGQEDSELLWVLKLGEEQTELKNQLLSERAQYDMMARAHLGYVLPIRANYTMRMMSDLYPDKSGFELPSSNTCEIPFAKQGGE